MDQSYQQSIDNILADMGLIEQKLTAIDAAVTRSATNLASAAQKLNAATPNDMKDVVNGNTKAVDQFSAAIQKANILQIKYEQEKEKLGKIQAQRLVAEETLKSKIQKNEIAASEQIIKQKQKEAKILDAAQTKAISRTQQQINIEKQALAESVKLTNQKRIIEAKLDTERERQANLQQARIIKHRKEEERLAKAAIADAEKLRKAESDAIKAKQKAIDDAFKAQENAFNKKAAAEQKSASQDARQIANQKALADAADLEAKATSKLVGAYGNLQARREQARQSLQNLIASRTANNKQIAEATKRYNDLTARVNAATVAQQKLATVGNGSLATAFNSIAGGLRNLMAAFGIVGGLYLFADWTKQAYQLVRQLDSLHFAMRTIITDSEELARTQGFIADITERYGAALVTTTERYIKFLAAAKQSNVTLEDTERIFGTVTKAAGALGLKSHELEGIYLALEQMLSKGKVTTEELRRQLGERLPGAFGIMAKALNVTVSELDKMLRAGEVLSSDALPKFADALEKAYGIENLDRVENLNAATTRLSNGWIEFVANITQSEGPISSVLVNTLGFLNTIIDKIGIINMSLGELYNRAQEKGNFEIMETLKKDVDSLGVSLERAAERRLPDLRKELRATEEQFKTFSDRLREHKEEGLSEVPVLGWAMETGMETRLKETGELMAKQQEMVRVLENLIYQEERYKNVTAEPLNLKNYDDLFYAINEAEDKYNDLSNKIEVVKNAEVVNEKRLEDLEIERFKVFTVIEQYKELAAQFEKPFSMKTPWEDPFKTSPDRNFFADRLKQLEEEYELTTANDEASRTSLKIQITNMKEILTIWDGIKEKKEKATKDYTQEDAFSLTEGRLEREMKIQEEIRDNLENSLSERLDAERIASQREVDLLILRRDEALRVNKDRADLVKNIHEQFYADLMNITEQGEDRIEQIQSQDFDKRLKEFDKITAANKFAMEKEIENVREIGIRRGWTQKYIEEQVLMIREIYAKKTIESQIENAIKELEVFAGTAEEKEKIQERLLQLQKELNDLQVKGLPKGKDDVVKTWEERVEAAEVYIDKVKEIAGQLGALFSTMSNARMETFDAQIEASDRLHERLLENEFLTEEQRTDLEESRRKKEEQLNERKRKERIRQAQMEKKFALFDIAINTAVEISKALGKPWLIALIALAGALQAATVIATPIPKYAKGRRGGKEEYAWVGDAGKREPILDKHGQLKDISPNTPVITKLEHGDTVLSDESKLKPENFRGWKNKKPKYLTAENVISDYNQIVNSTISATLANSKGDMDSERLARVFDAKLHNLKKEVRDGIKDGFDKIKLPENRGNKELADRLKFLDRRDAL